MRNGHRRPYGQRARAERLVATGRVALATVSLLAILMDPAEPAKAAQLAYTLLVAYVIYAAVLAVWVHRRGKASPWIGLADHSFDLLFFSVFMYFTSGPASPFFAYFVFCLVGATLRWQWRGTLWTGIASVTAYLGVGISFGMVGGDPDFELNRFIIRAGYLVVVAMLLGYLGQHEEQSRRELVLLSQVPAPVTTEPEEVVQEVLPWVAKVLGARRIRLEWADREEPGARVAEVGADGIVSLGFESGSSPYDGHWLADGASATTSPERSQHLDLRLEGETVSGRLLVHDPARPPSESLPLAEAVAAVVASRLDHLHLARRLREGGASSERIELGRDLHDGVLQSLTGIALRLASLERLLDADREAARRQLEELRQLVSLEQRELRFLIDELRSASSHGSAEAAVAVGRVAEMAASIERVWDVDVTLDDTGSEEIPEHLTRHVHLLLREGLVNAARHAQATRIEVEVGVDEEQVRLRVVDDGRGWDFVGRQDLPGFRRGGGGPRSLMERVEALGGTLSVESSAAGSLLQIAVPLRWEAANT